MTTDAEQHVWENEDGDLVVVLASREYTIEDVDAETGLWVQRLMDKSQKAKQRLDAGESAEDIDADMHLSDEQESDLYSRVLGSTLDELIANGAKWKRVQFAGQIAYAWIARGLEGARAMWESDGAPKANREQRRAASRASGSKPKANGASASTTKRPASTSRTRTRT